jgi:hypothetical protein
MLGAMLVAVSKTWFSACLNKRSMVAAAGDGAVAAGAPVLATCAALCLPWLVADLSSMCAEARRSSFSRSPWGNPCRKDLNCILAAASERSVSAESR